MMPSPVLLAHLVQVHSGLLCMWVLCGAGLCLIDHWTLCTSLGHS